VLHAAVRVIGAVHVHDYLGPDLRCAGRRANMAGRCTHLRNVVPCTFHVREMI
jgi:hypothetical protein